MRTAQLLLICAAITFAILKGILLKKHALLIYLKNYYFSNLLKVTSAFIYISKLPIYIYVMQYRTASELYGSEVGRN